MAEDPQTDEPQVRSPGAPPPLDAPTDDPSALEARAAEVLRAAEAVAAETGRAMVSEAKDVRRRILQDADRRRAELVRELERVRELLDRALDALRAPDAAVGEAEPGASRVPPPANDVFARIRAAEPSEPPAPRASPRRRRGAKADDQTDVSSDAAHAAATPSGAASSGGTSGEAPVEPPAAVAGAPDDTAANDGADPPAVPAPPPDPDDTLRRRRDAVLEPLVPAAVRAAKRLLQDEQNSLLDAVRRARGRYEPPRLLPEHEHQREAWTAILTPTMDAAFVGGRAASGKAGRVSSAPTRVVGHALAIVVTQLRDRLAATIEAVGAEGPYESPNELQRALGSAIGARYREWKSAELEARLRDAACAAYARGSFEAAGVGTPLRWVPADPGRCPDCDDNALEPTIKGSSFPTGQSHPPAHPGCRCLVVPFERGGGPAVTA